MKNNLKNINLFAKRALTTPPYNSQINSATFIGSISVVDTTVSDLSQTRVLPTVDRRSNYTSSTSCAISSSSLNSKFKIQNLGFLRRVAMLLCVLMLSIGNVWGEITCKEISKSSGEVYLVTPANMNTYYNSGNGWVTNASGGAISSSSYYTTKSGTNNNNYINPETETTEKAGASGITLKTADNRSARFYFTGATKVSAFIAVTGSGRTATITVYKKSDDSSVKSTTGQNYGSSGPYEKLEITGLSSSEQYYAKVTATNDMCLYAMKFFAAAASTTYTVTFDANGGSVMPASATQASTSASISLPTPTKTGYSCEGWFTATSGGTERGDAGGSYVPTATETIYAQWTGTTPSFSAQPQGATYNQNASATALSVTASANGGTLSYQWQSSTDQSNWSNVGTNSNSYTPSTATVGDMYYRCVVTNTTGSKSANSDAAKITISAPTTKRIYVKLCSAWEDASAKFGLYDITNRTWNTTFLTKGTGCEDGYYYDDVPTSCQKIIVGRFASGTSQPFGWEGDNWWGQSVDFDMGTTNNYIHIDGWGTTGDANGKGYGGVGVYSAPTYTVTCGVNTAGYGSVSSASVSNVPCGTAISTSGNKLTVGSTDVTATATTATEQYTYTFNNWTWTPAGASVMSEITATANFTRTTNQYTINALSLTGCSVTGTAWPSGKKDYGSSFSTTISANTGYDLPDKITVSGATYTWTNGALSITGVTGNVSVTITATAKKTTVTLDNQGATKAGQTSVTATYGQAMPSIASNLPEKDGYDFGGYYTEQNGGGTKYINANGTSAKNWNIEDQTKTLYANWVECTPLVATASFSAEDVGFNTAWTNNNISKNNVTVTVNGSSDDAHTMTKPAIKGSKNSTVLTFVIPDGVVEGTISVDACTYSGTATTMKIYKGDSEIKSASLTSSHKINSPDPNAWTDPTLCTFSISITSGGTYYVKETGNKSNVYIYSFSVSANNGCTPPVFQYNINYAGMSDATHGTNHPTSGSIGSAFAVSAPTKSGYTFTGWKVTDGLNPATAKWGTTSSTSNSINDSSTPCVNGTSDVYFKDLGVADATVTLTATWTEAQLTKLQISGSSYFKVGSSTTFTATRTPVEATADQVEWSFDKSSNFTLTPNGDQVTITASAPSWAILSAKAGTITAQNSYTVGAYVEITHEANSGSTPAKPSDKTGQISRSYGNGTDGTVNQYVFPTSQKNGYTLEGWYTDDQLTQKAGEPGQTQSEANFYPTTDVTLYAKWMATTITLDKNGGTANGSIQVVPGTNQTSSFSPVTPATGYVCIGYYDAATDGTKYLNPDGTIYYLTGGTSGEQVFPTTPPTMLYAHYQSVSDCSTFNGDGALSFRGSEGKYYSTGAMTFYNNSAGYTNNAICQYQLGNTNSKYITGNLSNNIIQSFAIGASNGGTVSIDFSSSVPYDDDTKLGTVTKNADGTTYDVDVPANAKSFKLYTTSNQYVYVDYVSICPVFTVTFNKNVTEATGTMESQQMISGRETALTANSFEYANHTFAGWAETADGEVVYEDEEEISISANTTLYAKWTPNAYTVTASVATESAGWGTVSPASVADVPYGTSISVDETDNKILHVGTQTITATPATTTDQFTYDFSSWSWTDDVTTVTKNITATATFTRSARTYNINYILGGGEWDGDHITQYTCATTTTLPTNIEHTGWIFLGWYDNSGLTGDPVTEIGTAAYGEKTFYAKWDTPQCADMLIYDGSTMASVPTGSATGTESTSNASWECNQLATNNTTISKTYNEKTYTHAWGAFSSPTNGTARYIKVTIPAGYKAIFTVVGYNSATTETRTVFLSSTRTADPTGAIASAVLATDGSLNGFTFAEQNAGTYYICASSALALTELSVRVCEGEAQLCTTPTIAWVNAPEDAVVGAAPMTATVTTNQSNPDITWESTNTAVATVSDGVITYVGAGSTTIKAYYTGDGETYCNRQAEITNDITVAPIWTVWTNMIEGDEHWQDVAINAQNQASITPAQRSTSYRFLLRKQVKSNTSADGAYAYYGATTGENNYNKDQSGQPWTLNGTTDVNLSVTAKDDYLFLLANLEETAPQVTVTFPTAYTITFNGNGSDGGTAMTSITNLATGDIETLPANTYEKHGFEFMGWATSSTGEVVYRNQADVTIADADIELFAVWSSAKYTVTFDANGGTVSPTTAKQARTNGTVQMLVPTRDGYSCTGWYTLAEGGNLVAAAGAYYIPQSDITVYAHWEQLTTTWYIRGDFDWNTGVQFVRLAGQDHNKAFAVVEWNSSDDMAFKIYNSDGETWYGNENKMTRTNCTGWNVWSDNNSNTKMAPTGNGHYIFQLDLSGEYPAISLSYPNWNIDVFSTSAGSGSGTFSYVNPVDWDIKDFVIPTATNLNNSIFWVGDGQWNGSYSENWHARWIMLNQYVSEKIGHGVEGAVGTLHINPFANSKNYGLRFDPAGYGFVYGSGSGVGDLTSSKPFAQKMNDLAVWNTPGEELTADLKNANFYVGLATQTAGSYKFSYDYGSNPKECNGLSQVAAVGDIKVWNEADPQYWTSTVSDLSVGTHGHFQIWADNASQKNFYIHYIIDNKLTFDLNGATSPASIDPMYVGQNLSGEDCNVTLPTGLTRTGYDFAGWKIDGVAYAAGATYALVDDATAVAQWTPQTYTITFDANGGTIDGNATKVMSYIYDGEALTLPTTDDRTGYTYANWWTARTDGSQIDNVGGSNKPTANTTYYAHWMANQYTLTLYKNDGTDDYTTVQVTYDAACPQTLPEWTRTGYDFDNFYTAAVGGDKITKKDGDTWKFEGSDFAYTKDAKWHYADNDAKLYAHWTAHNNSITWDGLTGATVEGTTPENANYGTTITLPTVSKIGYNFTGWTIAPTVTVTDGKFTMPDENLTITANWSVNSYTLAWEGLEGATVTGGTPAGSVEYGAALTAPTVSKTGYTFKEWNPAVPATMPASDKTYTAQWTANTNTPYTVKHFKQNLENDEYTLAETDNLTGTTGAKVTPPTKSYSGFTAPTAQEVTILANGSLVVEYQYTRNLYKLTWDNVQGATVTGGTPAGDVKFGAEVTAPTVSKTGYTFKEWNPAVPATMPASDKTYTAQYTAKTIQITFNANGGKFSDESTSKTLDYIYDGAALTLPTPTNGALIFDGWYTGETDGSQIDNVGGTNKPAENTTYYAHWQKVTPVVTWADFVDASLGELVTFTITTTSDADLTGDNVLTVTNGTLKNKTIDGKTITAQVACPTTAKTVTVNFATAATDTYKATETISKTISVKACATDETKIYEMHLTSNSAATLDLGAEGSSVTFVKNMDSGTTTVGDKTYYKFGSSSEVKLVPAGGFVSGDKVVFDIAGGDTKTSSYILTGSTGSLVSTSIVLTSGVATTIEYTFTSAQNYITIKRGSTNGDKLRLYGAYVTSKSTKYVSPDLTWADGTADKGTKNKEFDPVTAANNTFAMAVTSESAGTISYTSSATDVATIDGNGNVIMTSKGGTTILTASVTALGCYKAEQITCTLKVTLPAIAKPTVSITTEQDGKTSVCAGDEETFGAINATAECETAGATLTYQWFNGESAVTEATVDDTQYKPTGAGTYTCKVTASKVGYTSVEPEASNGITYTVVPLPAANEVKMINDILVTSGNDYEFVLSDISNAETYTLTWDKVGPAAVTEPTTRGDKTTFTGSIGSTPGNYTGTLTFFNSLGCSTEYELTLNVTVTMTVPEVVTPVTICADGVNALTFSCSNEPGENEIFYWQTEENGTDKTHENTITSPVTAGTYTYYVRCYNEEFDIFGTAVSCTGTIQPTLVLTELANAFYLVNATATALDATATGGIDAKSYQWQSSTDNTYWEDITTGGDGATYTPLTTAHGTTYYRCQVTSGACEATTNVAEVEVCGHYPVVTTPTTAQTLNAIVDEAVTLHVTAAPHTDEDINAWGLTYQWYKGETLVPGATDADYTFEQVKTTDAGTYYCKVSEDGGCYEVTSPAFTLSVTGTEPTCDWKEIISAVWTSTTSATVGGTIGGTPYSDGLSGSGPYKIDKNNLPNGAGVTLTTGTFKKGDKVTVHWIQADMTPNFQLFADANGTIELVSDELEQSTSGNPKTYEKEYELQQDAAGIYLVRTSDNKQNHQIYSISVSRYMCDEGLMTFMDYTGDGKWSTAANWAGTTTPATSLPTIGTITKIKKSVTVTAKDAQAARVDLCDEATLTIAPTGGLNVAGKVQHEDGSATTVSDITIQSTAAGNGALVFNNNDGQSAATVQLYSKAYTVKNEETGKYIKYWQYMGMPTYVDDVLDIFEGAYLYRYHEESGWEKINAYNSAFAWYGYGVAYSKPQAKATQENQPEGVNQTYVFAGNLQPTTSQAITLTNTKDGAEGANLVANSWTAPINIKQFDLSDFAGAQATVYIYNTGKDVTDNHYADGESATAGQWSTYPVNTVKQSGWKGATTIASMQAFQVNVAEDAESATLTLDYDRLVRPATGTIGDNVMRAPARATETEAEPEMMWMRVADADTRADIYLLQRSDFSANWDNGWDGSCFGGDGRSPEFYSVSDELGKMTVQATDDWEGMPIGFAPTKPTAHTISFDYNGMTMWYLNDIKTQTSTLIDAANTYSFTSEEGDDEARFYISRTPFGHSTPTDYRAAKDGIHVQKVIYKEHLYIIQNGQLFDGTGKMMRNVIK